MAPPRPNLPVLLLLLLLLVTVKTIAANDPHQQCASAATDSGSGDAVCNGTKQPPSTTATEVVPSRSSSFPTNLILSEDGLVNSIGQRPIDNSVKVWFTLHPNGDGLGEGIRLLSQDFTDIDDVIGKHCCVLVDTDQNRCAPGSGARLVSDTGVRLLSFNDAEDGQRVYCVPQSAHFVWPLKKTGSTFYPKNVVGPIPGKPIRMKQLSEQPRVFSVENFVSPEEVDEILKANSEQVTLSEVGFGGWHDDTRTSSTAWDDDTAAAMRIRTRTFQILAMDENAEMADTLQVLRYRPDGYKGKGEWYKPHVDWFGADSYDGHDPVVNNGSNRFATMFLYLSDVEEGGATVFPLSTTHEGYNGEKLVHDGTVDTPGYINTLEARYCCNESSTALRSKPVRGNAVLFYSQGPDGALDPYSLHGGCPPLKGTKWSANVWIWNRKSPDKSAAKDKAPSEEAGDPDSVTLSFLNTLDRPVQIYWDSLMSDTPDVDQLTIQELRQAMQNDKTNRFQEQYTLEGLRESELNSYVSHVFVAVDTTNEQLIWYGVAESNGQLLEIREM